MRKSIALVLTLLLLSLTACSKPAPSSGDTPADKPAAKQQVTIAVSGEAATLDPHKSFNGFVFTVTNQIYETLVTRAANGELQPRLATDWKTVDEVTWELKLRQGVKFSDGTPFDAAAVKFNIERLKNPETKAPGAFIVGMIKEIQAVDELTVRLTTDKPFAPLPAHLSHPVTAMVSPKAGDLAKSPVGTGPFTLDTWKTGESFTLTANAYYWGGKPKLDTVVIRVIPEAGTQRVELEAGTVDLITGLLPEQFGELANSKTTTASRFLGWGSVYLGFNMQAGPLAKAEVRQAIARAIDRQGIVQTLRQGMAEEAASMVPKTVFGSADLQPIPYDVAAAKDLLQKAGVTTPLKLKLNTFENAETTQIAGALQAQLKEVGIDLEVSVTDYGAFAQAIAEPNHDLWLTTWGTVTMDADYTLYALLHSAQHGADNKAFYANADVDRLLEQARSTADEQVRSDAYRQIEEQVQKDLPYLTLYYPLTSYAKSRRLEGESFPFSSINLDLRKAEVR